MKHHHKRHHLQDVPLFAACTRNELDLIWTKARQRHFTEGQILGVEGEPGDDFVVIIDGTAEVTIAGAHVTTLGPSDFFGEVALLDGGPRTATVTATSAVEAYAVSRDDFFWVLENAPTLTENLLVGVAARLRDADSRMLH